jgi:general secretion pathway protein F/type IV pilus assembly protein PilC
MPEFTYTARNIDGTKVSGKMSANTERDVIGALSQQSLFPIEVTTPQPSKPITFGGGVSDQKIAVFYEQLASLLNNGVPLLRSLSILRDQTKLPTLKAALNDVISRVEDGENLSDAFNRHPKIFSEMAVNMARAGAEGGFLEDALARVAKFTEQAAELRGRTIGAMIYPAVLFSMGSVIVAVLLVYFVPKFESMFETLRATGQLPWVTELLLAFSTRIQFWGLPILILMLIAFFTLKFQLQTPRGRRLFDGIKIKIPMLGSIFLNLSVARFCRVLGTLLKNGVPILKALDISREAAGNKVLSEAIAKASENITAGESLSVPLRKSGHFPHDVVEMLSVAEESNSLDSVLVNISDGLEKQTIRRLDLMVKLIEPLMLMVMAAVVLVVVVALLLPIMKMGSALE